MVFITLKGKLIWHPPNNRRDSYGGHLRYAVKRTDTNTGRFVCISAALVCTFGARIQLIILLGVYHAKIKLRT